MALQETARAAGVNPYNGMSDDHTQAGIFQSLLDREAGTPAAAPASPPPSPPAAAAPPGTPPEAPSQPDSAPQEPQADDGPEFQDFDDFLEKVAKEKGWDLESIRELPSRTKIDGKDGAVPYKELLKSYQLDAHITQKSQALADERRAWDTQKQQAQQLQDQQLQQAKALVQQAHQMLMGDYGQVNWQQLAINDPASYNQHWPIFQQRAIAIKQALEQTQALSQQQALQQQQALAERLPKEQEALLAARPTWRDSKTFDAARKDIQDYGTRMGLSPAEWQSVAHDHRMMLILHDAAQAQKLQAQAPQVLKKVRAAPQMAAPGARTITDPKTGQQNQLRELAFSKRGRSNDQVQAAYFEQLLNSGA